MARNLGVLTSWNPVGLFRPVMGQLYLYLYLLPFTLPGQSLAFVGMHADCLVFDTAML
jgi:hypothetical protein